MFKNMPTQGLFLHFLALLIILVCCLPTFRNPKKEAMRLFELSKLCWTKSKDEDVEYKKIEKRIVLLNRFLYPIYSAYVLLVGIVLLRRVL